MIGLGSVLFIKIGLIIEEEGDKEEYVWQEWQWCPGGLTRSQKRMV